MEIEPEAVLAEDHVDEFRFESPAALGIARPARAACIVLEFSGDACRKGRRDLQIGYEAKDMVGIAESHEAGPSNDPGFAQPAISEIDIDQKLARLLELGKSRRRGGHCDPTAHGLAARRRERGGQREEPMDGSAPERAGNGRHSGPMSTVSVPA